MRYSLHTKALLRSAQYALLRRCRNVCRAIGAIALMSKLLDAICLIIENDTNLMEKFVEFQP